MIDVKARIREVFERGYLMSLGTADSGGPWVADVLYVYDDDLNLYWTSSPRVRHSQAIKESGRAAGSITVNAPKENNFGVQFEGRAEELSGVHLDLVAKIFKKRGRVVPADAANLFKGNSWYKLTPSKIELIDEANFGFKKQPFTA